MAREDAVALGRLFLDAYVGTIDYEGETEADAAGVVQSTFDGEFGEFVRHASMVVEEGGELVSASFVTLWKGAPLLAFSVTAPPHKGRGLAGLCIRASMRALEGAGYSELHLFVTPGNDPALSAYNRLGFTPVS